ncbi:FAD-binding domain-containing protein [Xylaria bambusicola]|uniref:FAD-binding domain-containing protein n=1 Tax=Xylaria bambusicola TaxID=326684 RepID=UPI0020084B97|nr:FAD-binding domain-containing protein [Xylaria bambusicola]KAI0514709.1 FAD-binding domain-containing protein [Xylaria bambusicola]
MLHSQKAKALAACQALSAALPGQVYFPDSQDWHTASTGIWSKTCVLAPQCVFEPNTTLDLSNGVKLIKEHESLFAVRSGGHMAVPGAQSVNEGIMISMSKFHTKSLNQDKSIASIGPGQLWLDVYTWLAEHGLAVNGGRYPMVGVGGVLLGGGMGYFAGQRGWSVDDIVGWEVVLADGLIVEVTTSSEDAYSDLAWALRGGHNYFGIVTRFDMRTFPAGSAYGGLVVYSAAAEESFFAALDAYMAPGGGSEDPKSAINPVSTMRLVNGEWELGFLNVYMYADSDAEPVALQNFTNISAEYAVFSSADLHDSWIGVPRSLASMATREDRTLFWAITFKADRRAIDIVSQLFYRGALNELNHVEGLSLTISFQPLTVPYLTASKMKGGNLMGLDPDKDSGHFAGILFPTWNFERDDEAVYDFTRKAAIAIEEKLRKLDLFHPYIYINDAAKGQKPFSSYAGGAHLARLQTIQTKYDPDGFIRDYLQHGFELASPGSSRSHGEL